MSAEAAPQLEIVRTMFAEYAALLRQRHQEACVKAFQAEIDSLPGAYASPAGCLLLALRADEGLGCVGLRPSEAGRGEMKRLYVRPAARGLGLGRKLAEAVLEAAWARGMSCVRLDTLPHMTEAVSLYRSLGFREIPAYADHPMGAICFERSR